MDLVKHYYDRLAEFGRQAVSPGGIVFLGSSHLEWFDSDRLLPGFHIVNRAIVGDYIGIGERGILRRLEVSVFDCQPRQAILHNGVNDLGELYRTGRPELNDISACYKQVVESIQSRSPHVPLVLVCVLPTGKSRAGISKLVPKLNEHIQRIAETHGCQTLDMWSDFADMDGLLRPELTEDDLHLNESGYGLYASRLRPLLVRDSGE